ncbi:hypothetical protein JHK86_001445 [Glycine max]|nr:hypothetical protein JHK86_001445 [Glycine max]
MDKKLRARGNEKPFGQGRVPLPTNMGSLRVEKDKVVVGDISGSATLDDVVAAIKKLQLDEKAVRMKVTMTLLLGTQPLQGRLDQKCRTHLA